VFFYFGVLRPKFNTQISFPLLDGSILQIYLKKENILEAGRKAGEIFTPVKVNNPETGLRGLEGSGRLRLPDF
jgi:hypothetical protein